MTDFIQVLLLLSLVLLIRAEVFNKKILIRMEDMVQRMEEIDKKLNESLTSIGFSARLTSESVPVDPDAIPYTDVLVNVGDR